MTGAEPGVTINGWVMFSPVSLCAVSKLLTDWPATTVTVLLLKISAPVCEGTLSGSPPHSGHGCFVAGGVGVGAGAAVFAAGGVVGLAAGAVVVAGAAGGVAAGAVCLAALTLGLSCAEVCNTSLAADLTAAWETLSAEWREGPASCWATIIMPVRTKAVTRAARPAGNL